MVATNLVILSQYESLKDVYLLDLYIEISIDLKRWNPSIDILLLICRTMLFAQLTGYQKPITNHGSIDIRYQYIFT